MATVFTKIIQGELPGRMIYEDELAAAFLTIEPVGPGHTLVVPKAEIDHWLDLPQETAQHLFSLAQKIGQAIKVAFDPPRVGMMIAGFEVAHTHLHVFPAASLEDFSPQAINHDASIQELDDAAQKLRQAFEEL